jgi:hypothetical protein
MSRVGQNLIYTPYMTIYLVISLPKIPYIHRIYMVLANPKNEQLLVGKVRLHHYICLKGHLSGSLEKA